MKMPKITTGSKSLWLVLGGIIIGAVLAYFVTFTFGFKFPTTPPPAGSTSVTLSAAGTPATASTTPQTTFTNSTSNTSPTVATAGPNPYG